MAPPSSRNRQGFTLAELLVTVVLMILLTALLIPAVQRIRERGQAIQCANNLRQLYTAFMAYAADHQMEIPVDRTNASTGRSWWTPISPYLKHGGYGKKCDPYFCPVNPVEIVASGAAGWTNYGINRTLYIDDSTTSDGADYMSKRRGMRFTQIPGIKALLVDSCNKGTVPPKTDYSIGNPINQYPLGQYIYPVHENSVNILFTDGHVQLTRVAPRPAALVAGDLVNLKAEWFYW